MNYKKLSFLLFIVFIRCNSIFSVNSVENIIQRGDLTELEDTLKDASQSQKDRALIEAAELENPEAVELVLSLNANPNAQDSEDNHVLTFSTNESIIRSLISHGANKDLALFVSSGLGFSDIVDELLLTRANPNYEYQGISSIHMAVSEGHKDIVERLINAGATLVTSRDGISPLMIALEQRHFDIAKLLLGNGANPDIEVSFDTGENLLMEAAEQDDLEKIKILLKHHANIDSQDIQSNTPLMYAAKNGNANAFELLLAYGADPSLKNNEGKTSYDFIQESSLSEAEKNRLWLLMKVFLRPKPIYLATVEGNINLLEKLLQQETDLNARDTFERTPLMWAAIKGDRDAILMLLANGDQINLQDQEGMTPLMLATKFGQEEAIRILIANGADKTIFNKNNKNVYGVVMGSKFSMDKRNALLRLLASTPSI